MAIPGTTFYLHLLLLKRTKLHVTCLFVGDDSESSDSGVDTLSTSTRGSFPSDYMDLDEFLSVQTQNCQENTQASCEDPQNLSLVASTSTRVAATTVSGLVEQVSPAVTEFSKVAASVNNVLSSVVLSKMSSLPLQVDPAVFQTLRANTSQPEGTNAIVQWCQSVGGQGKIIKRQVALSLEKLRFGDVEILNTSTILCRSRKRRNGSFTASLKKTKDIGNVE